MARHRLEFNPAPGETQVLTRAGWVEGTIDAWAQFASPVAQSMNDALASVIADRLGGAVQGEIAGMFAGPVPIPIPEGMKDPEQLMKLLGNTSFAMQLGRAPEICPMRCAVASTKASHC